MILKEISDACNHDYIAECGSPSLATINHDCRRSLAVERMQIRSRDAPISGCARAQMTRGSIA